MILISPIKRIAAIYFLLIGSLVYAQEGIERIKAEATDEENTVSNSRQRSAIISFDMYKPTLSGKSAFAESSEENIGFTFNLQFFVYKQFFMGFASGNSYFNNKNISKTGNYNKTRVTGRDIYIGYEFLPTDNLRLGVGATVVGGARYKNILSSASEVYQIDHSAMRKYRLYIGYDMDRTVSIYVNYAFRQDRTEIDVPAQLNSSFSRIHYHNFGLGIRLYLGSDAIF